MNFVVLGRDRPGGEARARCRSDHLRYVEGHQSKIVYAGPLLEEGRMVGSLFVFDVPDRATLDSYLADELKLELQDEIADDLQQSGLRPEERQVLEFLKKRLKT